MVLQVLNFSEEPLCFQLSPDSLPHGFLGTALDHVSVPAARLRTVTQDTSLKDALELMATNDLNQLPVLANGRLRGMVSRSQVLQLFQTRAELQA